MKQKKLFYVTVEYGYLILDGLEFISTEKTLLFREVHEQDAINQAIEAILSLGVEFLGVTKVFALS